MTQALLTISEMRVGNVGPVGFDVPAGRCVAVFGESGSGKTRLLRAIADLDPNEGRCAIAGDDRGAMPAPNWRARVMYVAAEPGWWAETAGEHLRNPDAAPEMLGAVGLDPRIVDRPVAQLSTGERQRLALVRALERRPDVLMLDEPTGALDTETRDMMATFLKTRLDAGLGLLVVTHDDTLAQVLGAERLELADGRLRTVSVP